ncbi:MAG: helix-turn-helix domain-containing protein [Deltaproteobacteria bacterium]|nr:helix-turn-helix domain-containing protein [Deltaproteobacteria bacterium]
MTNPAQIIEKNIQSNALLSPRKAALLLAVSTVTLSRWRQNGDGPQFLKLGNHKQSTIRYRFEDLMAFLHETTCPSRLSQKGE